MKSDEVSVEYERESNNPHLGTKSDSDKSVLLDGPPPVEALLMAAAGSAGPITSAADSLQIRLFGRGAHGSMPQASIDPVVMAASVVLRLQTIVAREVAATDAAVITVGVLQAGTKEKCHP
jgi:metal-dependent amidase/aminoacylase/carboxypeptidase family protein